MATGLGEPPKRTDVDVIYSELRSVSQLQWEKTPIGQIQSIAPDSVKHLMPQGAAAQGATLVKLLGRCAHALDANRFYESYAGQKLSDDLPPMKLSKNEMEYLKGGWGAR